MREREAAYGHRAPPRPASDGGLSFFGNAIREAGAGSEGGLSDGVDLIPPPTGARGVETPYHVHQPQMRFNPAETMRNKTPGGKQTGKGGDMDRGGMRRKYQDLAEVQQKVLVLMDEYQARRTVSKRHTYDRLYSLGHSEALIQQLSHLPSLDQALVLIQSNRPSPCVDDDPEEKGGTKEGNKGEKTGEKSKRGPATAVKASASASPTRSSSSSFSNTTSTNSKSFNNQWLYDLPRHGLEDAVDMHLQTMEALADKEKWSLVALPNNITGPPVDIKRVEHLTSQASNRKGGKGRYLPPLAAAWADGDGAEESLYWVAYATQGSKLNAAKLSAAEHAAKTKEKGT